MPDRLTLCHDQTTTTGSYRSLACHPLLRRPPGNRRGDTVFRINDGPLVAIVRVQPAYPAAAETRGLEGWVLVEFDVRADGGVANAFVVESSSQIFEKASLDAVYRFRFKPRVVDGVPQLTAGLQNLFRFEFSEE